MSRCGMKRYRVDLSHLKDKPTDSALETKFQEMMQQRSLSSVPVDTKEYVTESVKESVKESVPAHMTPWKTPSSK
jgi:phage gp46-like protein